MNFSTIYHYPIDSDRVTQNTSLRTLASERAIQNEYQFRTPPLTQITVLIQSAPDRLKPSVFSPIDN